MGMSETVVRAELWREERRGGGKAVRSTCDDVLMLMECTEERDEEREGLRL